ncbi:hypothetical protein M8J77_002590 [Diaphorina citri]|nr:hypothetical protein M8J77_002590 [Diaphorina citri]
MDNNPSSSNNDLQGVSLDELPSYPQGPFSQKMNKMWKGCFVPKCVNTTTRTPNKLFITLPSNLSIKKKWFKQARRPYNISDKSTLYACEDHFDIENDIENLLAFKMGFAAILQLKPNVYPRFFNCQTDRPTAHTSSKPRTAIQKRQKQELLETTLVTTETTPSPIESDIELHHLGEPHSSMDYENSGPKDEATQIDGAFFQRNKSTQTEVQSVKSYSKSVQFNVNKTFGRSKGINTENNKKDQATCTTQFYSLIYSSSSDESEPESSRADLNSTFMSLGSDCSFSDFKNKHSKKEQMLQIIKEQPLTFIGVPPESMHVCSELTSFLGIEETFVFICLLKIRLDWPFNIIASLFGYSSSHVARCFNIHVRKIAELVGTLVYWPSPEEVKYNLPLPFRHRYKDVYCIIDCLEIQIQKPTDPQHQGATWSEYKKGNTAKYLIASTPQGFINYVSHGYGGRITDEKIISESGFLDLLKPGTKVMADRGFKNIEHLFVAKGCRLTRPPSVFANKKPTKHEVKQTKQIASLRVIIENVIVRLRHFHSLKPHAMTPIKSLDQLDYMVQIACGLINIQFPVRDPVVS